MEEAFSLDYAGEAAADPKEVDVALEEDDPPEPLEGGKIDMGEAAAEHLALVLDPFPRVPGAVFETAEEGKRDEDEAVSSPFAALARLASKTRGD